MRSQPHPASRGYRPLQDRHTLSARDLIRNVFLASSDAFMVIDAAGHRLLDCNAPACKMLGYSRATLLRVPLTQIFGEQAEWTAFLLRARKKHKGSLKHTPCKHKTGRTLSVDISAFLIHCANRPCLLLSMRDLSVRSHQDEMAQERIAVERLLNAIIRLPRQTADMRQLIRSCLRWVCTCTRWPMGHAHFIDSEMATRAGTRDIWYSSKRRLESTQHMLESKSSRAYVFSVPLKAGRPIVLPALLDELLPHSAQARHGLASVVVLPVFVGKTVMMVCEFFSAKPLQSGDCLVQTLGSVGVAMGSILRGKRHDEALAEMSARLLTLQDDERRHLARELHDTTAQNISALLMDLNQIRQRIDLSDPATRSILSGIDALARQSLQEIRTLSYLLHPPMLDELGIATALRIFIEEFSKRSEIRVHLDLPARPPRLARDLELVIFRIVQEALTNVYRHSHSPTATVILRFEPAAVLIRIEDQRSGRKGAGYTPGKTPRPGMGLRGMRERVGLLGGELDYSFGESGGWVQALLPMPGGTGAQPP